MQVAPTTAQLIARAETAERTLEETIKEAEKLREAIKTAETLVELMIYKDMGAGEAHLRLLQEFLSHAGRCFDRMNDIPF